MIDNPWQFCVALAVLLCGLYFVLYRYLLRRNSIPVSILSITPRVIKELPNFTTIYGYDVEYILNGETCITKSVEFYITVLAPGAMVPYSSSGSLLKNGKVSIDNAKTNTCYGVILILFALGLLSELS